MRDSIRPALTRLALLAALTGCSQDQAGTTTPPPGLVAGLSVHVLTGDSLGDGRTTLRVRNESSDVAAFGPCAIYYHRRTGSRWVPATPDDRLCTAISHGVQANSTFELPFGMPAGTEPGTYRLEVEFLRDVEPRRFRVYSNEFSVQ